MTVPPAPPAPAPARLRRTFVYRGPLVILPSVVAKAKKAASAFKSQPSDRQLLDHLYAHDGTDLGVIEIIDETCLKTRVTKNQVVQLANLLGTNRLVVRRIVLKKFEGAGPFSTGEENIHWRRAAECKNFVLPYLGNVDRKMSDLKDAIPSTWMASPYAHPLLHIVEARDAYQDQSFLRKDRVLGYLRHLLSGLEFLHGDAQMIHCDFKLDNVFITETFDAVIGDFGLARSKNGKPNGIETSQNIRSMGSLYYLTPENIRGWVSIPGSTLPEQSARTQASDPRRGTYKESKLEPDDMWGFGVMVAHIYARTKPYSVDQLEELGHQISMGHCPAFPKDAALSHGLNFFLWRICRDCWNPLPPHRPSATALLKLIKAHDAQLCLGRIIPDLFECVENEVVDITNDICVQHSPPTIEGEATGYVCIKARWRPVEIAPRVVDVVLTRRGDSVTRDSTGWSQPLLDEVVRWRRVRHENLVPLLGVCSVDGIRYAVSPAYSRCDARAWLREEDLKYKQDESHDANVSLMTLLLDISKALAFLHGQGHPIMHGNVHIDNVFVPHYPTQLEPGTSVNACLGRFDRILSSPTQSPGPGVSEDIKMYGTLFCEVLRSRYKFPHDSAPEEFPGLPRRDEADIAYVHTIYRDTTVVPQPRITMSAIRDYLKHLILDAKAGLA